MTNEFEHNDEQHNVCFCKSKWFKKFLLMFLSVYLGILAALCTFCAFHKPKYPPFIHHKMMYKLYDKDFDFNQVEEMRKEMEKTNKIYDKEFEKIRKEQDREMNKIRNDINKEFEKRD